MKNKISIAVIGCGAMGGAIASCLLDPAVVAVQKANGNIIRLTVCDVDEVKILPFNGRCEITRSVDRAAANSEYVILAVPPSAAAELPSACLSEKVIISLMAGIGTETLKKLTGSARVVRAMPNINAAVGESYTAYCSCGLSDSDKRTVAEILGSFGMFGEIAERDIDAATGIVGCAPAFVYTAIKAVFDAAIAHGFDAAQAKAMAIQVFYGSALAAEHYDGSFDALIGSVCTPNGVTERGVEALRQGAFCETLSDAIEKSVMRAKEMNK